MRETKQQRASRQALARRVFVAVLRAAGNVVEEEVRFDARPKNSKAQPKIPRQWRWDIALPLCPVPTSRREIFTVRNIGIEIQGVGRGHLGVKDYLDDIEKAAEAFAQGWWYLPVTWKMIADGTVLDVLERAGVRVTKAP